MSDKGATLTDSEFEKMWEWYKGVTDRLDKELKDQLGNYVEYLRSIGCDKIQIKRLIEDLLAYKNMWAIVVPNFSIDKLIEEVFIK